MDIKEQITKAVNAIQSDKDLLNQFKADPIKAVEKVLGVDLPDEMIMKIVDGVKAKLTIDDAKKLAGALGGLFGKK